MKQLNENCHFKTLWYYVVNVQFIVSAVTFPFGKFKYF